MTQRMKIADLDEQALKKIHQVEQEFDAIVVALEPQCEPAQLTEQQTRKLEALEKEMGLVLLAYRK